MALFRIRKYSEFWPFYLQQHANRTCRGLHYVGTTIAIASLLACIATGNLWYLTVMVFGSYGFAWAGHFVFEKNRPATFQYPWWSLISDFRLYAVWIRGGAAAEFKKTFLTQTSLNSLK